jgi:hypothetical protein
VQLVGEPGDATTSVKRSMRIASLGPAPPGGGASLAVFSTLNLLPIARFPWVHRALNGPSRRVLLRAEGQKQADAIVQELEAERAQQHVLQQRILNLLKKVEIGLGRIAALHYCSSAYTRFAKRIGASFLKRECDQTLGRVHGPAEDPGGGP